LENYTSIKPRMSSWDLWQNIMFQPTATFKYIFENRYKESVFMFFVLGGTSSGISRLLQRDSINDPFDLGQLGISIVFGAALGWISYYLLAQFINIAGDLLNGKASVKKFRTVVAWALVPSILSLVFLIPQFLIFGAGSNSYLWSAYTSLNNVGLTILVVLTLILNFWSLVILVKGVAFIQNFSILKAVLNVILPFIIFAAIIFGFLALFAAINVLSLNYN